MNRVPGAIALIVLLQSIAAAQHNEPLTGEDKLRFLARQIELTADQRVEVEALVVLYAEERAQREQMRSQQSDYLRALGVEMRELEEEMAAANQAGETERAQSIEQRLEDIHDELMRFTPGYVPERHFFETLEAMLTPAQQQQLHEARQRLRYNPHGEMRPIDVVRRARRLDLTPEQQQRLKQLVAAFRRRMHGRLRLSDEERKSLPRELAAQIRAILKDGQVARFDAALATLDPTDPANRAPLAGV